MKRWLSLEVLPVSQASQVFEQLAPARRVGRMPRPVRLKETEVKDE
jgi:hypothetical protein